VRRWAKERRSGVPSNASRAGWTNPYKLPKDRFKTIAAWQQACWISDPLLSLYLDGWWDPLGGHNQIEFRHPFFDARLVDFLGRLPAEEKFWRDESKIVLRKGMETILPPSVHKRKGKAEFSSIVDFILRSMEIDIEDMALRRSGFIEGGQAKVSGEKGRAIDSWQERASLWRLVRTEAWYKMHFNSNSMEKRYAG
jgi:asparagine synthase (glutamine-hydrolysing)